MNRRLALVIATALFGSPFIAGDVARAGKKLPPAGHVTCAVVNGVFANSPSLYATNPLPHPFKIKGFGSFGKCDNSLNIGDPVVYGTFTISGYHPAPQTCTNANAPGYVLTLHVKWYAYNAATLTSNLYTTNATLASNSAFNPASCFTTSWTGASGTVSANPVLSGFWTSPSAGTASTQCASPTAAGGFVGFTFDEGSGCSGGISF